jgi:phosphoserine phosphatase RsbU/P
MAKHHAEQEEEKHLHEQTVLLTLTNQLLSHSTLEDVMSYLVEEVVRLLDVDACALLLPASSPSFPGWQVTDLYRPARQVGGDLYDYFLLPDGGHRLGLVIGDVAGQGVPAALFMATSRTLIRSAALADLTPGSTLSEANKLILQDSPSELFLSAFYGILDTRTGTLNYANAGHNPPLLYQQTRGDFLELRARGILLCVGNRISLEEKSATLDHNDILVLYTDGVTEAMNRQGEEFGVDRLRQGIAAHAEESASQILYGIVEAIDSFIGETEQPDDLTLVVAKRL